ncbi:MAG TPA: tRNA (adenosine(37)-N6)-threonylcarbamoyltransferase complex dimerization subunit type 1 TsaB [Caulobacteraceae bacterium]|nr:tRNA (adenosine(37)-N6)-threonylcarbamoyltransferase complex dimerization subunit type 1 TsaB [Caulobacteraceae bacterium]
MIVLALDTALETCSAALLDGGTVLAARSEPMARGHQERLAPLVAELMAEAGVGFDALDRIGVTVGPGSFTGLRVGLAFAKGLGVALDRPVVGVGTLEALAAESAGFAAAVIDARRDQVYLQPFRDGAAAGPPEALGLGDARQRLIDIDPLGPVVLIGSGAPLLAQAFPAAEARDLRGVDPTALARLAAAAAEPDTAPRPIYLRAPDAKLPASALSA